MTYITVRQHKKPRMITIEDVLFDLVKASDFAGESDKTGTITRKVEEIKPEVLSKINIDLMIDILERFNEKHKDLFEQDREKLYYSFKIPKSSGGWRDIDAPCEDLKLALSELAKILSEDFSMLYHTAAFAYIPGRSIVQAVKKHADFKSNWFLKTDLSGFFPSHTLPYIMKMLGLIFPTSEIVKTERGYKALEKAMSLGLYKDRLPQGSPLSP